MSPEDQLLVVISFLLAIDLLRTVSAHRRLLAARKNAAGADFTQTLS